MGAVPGRGLDRRVHRDVHHRLHRPGCPGRRSGCLGRRLDSLDRLWALCGMREIPSENKPSFAGGVGQGLDPTVETITAPVKHHRGHAGRNGPFGHQLADGNRR